MDKHQRLIWLTEEVNKHNKNYYVYDNPTISDAEYDALYYELVDLEKELGYSLPSQQAELAMTCLKALKRKSTKFRFIV